MKIMMAVTESGSYLDMPHGTFKKIVGGSGSDREKRKAVFAEFLSHHPYPRWEAVVSYWKQ